jgi:hypothetical protein
LGAASNEAMAQPMESKFPDGVLDRLVHPKRFELLTPRFVVWCSIQLSYGCTTGTALLGPDRRACSASELFS